MVAYTRQSTISDGDTITAALFNNEYNQLLSAFSYASSGTTGHKHDGTAGEGGHVPQIGDQDFLNKIVTDSTNNRFGIFVQVSSSAVEQIRIQDGAIVPVTDNDIDLGTSSVEFKDAYFDGTVTTDALVADTADINGGTVDGATIGASSATTIVGTTITANTAFVPDASDGAALGTSSLEFSDLFLADGAVINFGDDQDVTLTHVADTGLLLSSTDQLQFGDSGTYIHQSADGVLDLVSDTEIELTATTIDINGAVAMDGAITGGTNITISGELDAATLDISGNADIDGTTNLDAVDIDGAVQIDATVTVGVDDTGYDVKFFGATASAYMLWDASTDDLVLAGAAGIDLAGDIDVDGTANLDVVDIDGAVDMASTLTLAGNADFNGDLDVDGTTNLDAVDIDGAVQIDGTVTVGVDDTGKDVKFFGATSGSYLLWDESADSLLLTDSTPVKIGDSQDMTLYHDGSNSYLTNSTGALKVATETSGIAVTIGHTTSETTVADNLTVTGNASIGGNLDVTGSFDMSDADITNIGSIALDTITNDGTDITLDSSGDIILDAGGADIFFKDDGTTFGSATNTSGNLIIKSGTTTAFTFSGANVTGAGTYTGGGTMTTGGNIVIPDAGNIGSASDTDAIAIASDGVVTFSQVPVLPNNTIETADIQDNAVTLAKMAGLARGKIIVGDASGDPSALSAGSNGTFLKSDGTDLSFAAPSVALDDVATGDAAVTLATSAGNITIDAQGNDTDIIFKGTDGSSDTTFLTIDGSAAGEATFNAGIVIADDGNIGSASDKDAIAISSGGSITLSATTEATGTGSAALAVTGGLGVGKDVWVGDDLLLDSDSAVLKFGADQDVTLTHVADTGVTLSAGDNDTVLQIDSNNADAGSAPKLVLNRTTDSPADNDQGGVIKFDMENDNGQQFNAANIFAKATDVSNTTEDSSLHFQTITAGSSADALVLAGGRISSSAYSPAGSIVQVVTSSVFGAGTNSTSFADITNASVAITPASSSNKILVIANVDSFQGAVTSVNQIYTQNLYKTQGGSDTSLNVRYLSSQSTGGGLQLYASTAHAVLDAPSTTSEITYKIQHKVSNTGSYGYANNSGNYLIAMEVQV